MGAYYDFQYKLQTFFSYSIQKKIEWKDDLLQKFLFSFANRCPYLPLDSYSYPCLIYKKLPPNTRLQLSLFLIEKTIFWMTW